jgi:hypothetical protein
MREQNDNFEEENTLDMSPEAVKKRKIIKQVKIWGSVAGFLILILICIFIIRPAKTVSFSNGSGPKVESQTIGLSGYIQEPVVKDYKYHTFEGWYLRSDYSGSPVDFTTYKFKKSTTLFGKWGYISYSVKYMDEDGNEIENVTDNPTSYSVKHEGTEEEINAYHEKLRQTYIDRYGIQNINKYAMEITQKVESYRKGLNSGTINLVHPTKTNSNGVEFEGVWKDKDGNVVESLNCTEPQDLVLYASFN